MPCEAFCSLCKMLHQPVDKLQIAADDRNANNAVNHSFKRRISQHAIALYNEINDYRQGEDTCCQRRNVLFYNSRLGNMYYQMYRIGNKSAEP